MTTSTRPATSYGATAPPERERSGLTRRRLITAATAGALAPFAAGSLDALPAAARTQDDGRTLVIALSGSPVDIDPHGANEYRSALTIRGAFEQLIALSGDATDTYEGLLAESWSANEDQSVWTFTLRPNVTFHDGTPCDAEAVRLSFERLMSLGLGPGFEIGRFITDPGQVSAPDSATVVFDLGRPQPLFEAGISSQYGAQIVNAALARQREVDGDWGRAESQFNAEGLGTGPYRIVEFLPEEQVVLERFEGYWRPWEEGQFERIIIRVVPENESRRQLVERGEADIVDNLTPEALDALAETPGVAIDRSYSTEVDYFILTVAGVLASPEARQAMCYAFPYDEVIDGVYKGYGKRAIGPVAELCRGFAPDTFMYETDLARAQELFAAAGVAGAELSLVGQSGDANIAAAMQLLQANLSSIGINLSVETVDLGAYAAIIFGDVDPEEQPNVMPWYWWPAYNDAWNHLQLQVLCAAQGSAGTNAGYYCNPEVDALMDEARDAADVAEADRVLAEVQQILSRDDPPAIYYMQRQWPTVLRDTVGGFVFNPIYIGTYDFWRLRRA